MTFLEKYLAAHPWDIFRRGWVWQIFTANFLHGGFGHILANMLFLFFFGMDVEVLLGKTKFLAFYLTAGCLSIGAEAAIDYFVLGKPAVILGASGAVMASVVLFALFYPRRELYLGFMIPIQAWLLCVIYVGLDLTGMLGGSRDGIAHWAHLVGAACGFLYWAGARGFIPGPRLDVLRRLSRSRRRLRPRLVRDEGPPPRSPAPEGGEVRARDPISERIDELLEKISRSGRDSLTPEELEYLQKNSGRYRSGG